MELRRTYRVTSERAPRLLFELSRIGQRDDSRSITLSRERYRVGDADVSIDHLEPLGWFCVIAAERDEAIAGIAVRLALDAADLEPGSHAQLLGTGDVAVHADSTARGLRGRPLRLTLIAVSSAVLALFDLGLGALAVAALLLLEWAFGAPDGAGRSGGPART